MHWVSDFTTRHETNDRARFLTTTAMPFPRLTAALGCSVALAASLRGEELNAWPLWVDFRDEVRTAFDPSLAEKNALAPAVTVTRPGAFTAPDTRESVAWWSSLGPFLFSQPLPPSRSAARYESATRAHGFRPFYVRKVDPDGRATDIYALPPLFSWHATPFGSRWKIFSLIQREAREPEATPGERLGERAVFEVWPFYLSRQTGSPETSYRAVFPLYGDITHRFGLDRWSWVLFPLYGRFEKNGVTTTTAPWPFVKILRGEGNRGHELWPLFGRREKDGVYREQFYLWPLIYKNEHKLDEETPAVRSGFLPFFARTRNADSRSETYVWPFFGYFDRTAPRRYHETRYFWPLFVQGRGDDRFVNRWAPFYTHSSGRGVGKTWILWPLWRQRVSDEGALRQTKRQVLYILYNSTTQRSAANPALAPAHKTHLWPLFTAWDNGAGRKQTQALSPLEVFFPHNETVRLVYNPLFALYRHDETAPGAWRRSLLWNAVTWRRDATALASEFHLGPLFGATRRGGEKRYALLGGCVGLKRRAEGGWRPFFFEFRRRATDSVAARAGDFRAPPP